MIFSFSLDQISNAAQKCIDELGNRKVLAIHGPMGAGKTTLVHAICDLKKIKSTVTSPTFAIINEYNSDAESIFHIDLYRLKDEEEAVRSGVEDCLYSGKLCLVEWPEIAAGILPPDTLHVSLEPIDEIHRKITIGS